MFPCYLIFIFVALILVAMIADWALLKYKPEWTSRSNKYVV